MSDEVKYFNGMVEKVTIRPIENGWVIGVTRFSEHGETFPHRYYVESYEKIGEFLGRLEWRAE